MGANKKHQAKTSAVAKPETKRDVIISHKKKVASAIEYKKMEKEKTKNEKTSKIDRQKKEEIKKFREDEQVDAEGYFVLPEKLELNAEDEQMLDMFGTLDLQPKNKKSKILTTEEKRQAGELLKMAQELDANIESKNEQIRQDEIAQDFTKDPKVQQVYGDIANLFAKYRSGKVPQAFRILALADQWTNIMDVTKPENWTPHAMWAATKTFTTEMTVDR